VSALLHPAEASTPTEQMLRGDSTALLYHWWLRLEARSIW